MWTFELLQQKIIDVYYLKITRDDWNTIYRFYEILNEEEQEVFNCYKVEFKKIEFLLED
jgi:hypothetical protein